MERGVRTPVERYRKTALVYCTYHYWLIRGKSGGGVGVSLKDYADASRSHFFVISIPKPEDMRSMDSRGR